MEIYLRRHHPNVPKVSGEQRKLGAEIGIGLIPTQQPQHSKTMTKVVKPWAFSSATMFDTSGAEGAAEGFIQAPTRCGALTIGTRKECVAWSVMFQFRCHAFPILA